MRYCPCWIRSLFRIYARERCWFQNAARIESERREAFTTLCTGFPCLFKNLLWKRRQLLGYHFVSSCRCLCCYSEPLFHCVVTPNQRSHAYSLMRASSHKFILKQTGADMTSTLHKIAKTLSQSSMSSNLAVLISEILYICVYIDTVNLNKIKVFLPNSNAMCHCVYEAHI